MHSAILYQLTGDPDKDSIESHLGEGFPAIDAEATRYLTGKVLFHGTAAARIEEEKRVPMVGEDAIVTETEMRSRPVQTDWYADLDDGWAGIDTSDGEFLFDLLLSTHGVVGESIEIALDAWAEKFAGAEDASCWGLSYSQSIEDGDDADRAGAAFHQDASVHEIPPTGTSALGFYYRWDGKPVKGMIAGSGYVAVYQDWPAETFGAWLADEVMPYTVYDADSVDQAKLGEQVREQGGEA